MCPSFPFGIEGGMWDVIVLIPDHCLSIYFPYLSLENAECLDILYLRAFRILCSAELSMMFL